jgi:hypothetical protein
VGRRPGGFLSAWGCCARCGKVVTVRAPTRAAAVGSWPYVHKWRRGPDGGWCDGHKYPALHFTESDEFDHVETIHLTDRQHAEMMARRRNG